jgi:hypothetical protein
MLQSTEDIYPAQPNCQPTTDIDWRKLRDRAEGLDNLGDNPEHDTRSADQKILDSIKDFMGEDWNGNETVYTEGQLVPSKRVRHVEGTDDEAERAMIAEMFATVDARSKQEWRDSGSTLSHEAWVRQQFEIHEADKRRLRDIEVRRREEATRRFYENQKHAPATGVHTNGHASAVKSPSLGNSVPQATSGGEDDTSEEQQSPKATDSVISSPKQEDEPELQTKSLGRPEKRSWCYFDEYLELPDRVYWDDNGDHGFLIKMPGGSIMLVTGRWGSHKTNIVSKMVLDAVLDKGARALYIACEGQYLFGRERMPAFCEARGVNVRDLRDRFHFGDNGIVLTNKQSVAQVIEDNRDFRPNIVMIDTLTQATPGIDSNNKEMGDVLSNSGPVAAIRKEFNALVIVLAHPPKSAKITDGGDISGHGSIVGNTDTLAVTRYDKEKRIVTLTMERNKNGPEGLELWFNIPEYGFPVPEQLAEDPFAGKEEVEKRRDHDQEQAAMIRGILLLKVAADFDSGFSNKQMAELLYDRESWIDAKLPKIVDGVAVSREEWVQSKAKELSNVQQRKMQNGSPYSGLVQSQIKGKLTVRKWCWDGRMIEKG